MVLKPVLQLWMCKQQHPLSKDECLKLEETQMDEAEECLMLLGAMVFFYLSLFVFPFVHFMSVVVFFTWVFWSEDLLLSCYHYEI